MTPLEPDSTAEDVYKVIAEDICTSRLKARDAVVLADRAGQLNVPAQLVDQAMLLLQVDGLVEQATAHGLRVTQLDMDGVRHHYAIRGVLDGLAAREAANRARRDREARQVLETEGQQIMRLGHAAMRSGDVIELVRQDEALHIVLYKISGNPFLAKTAGPHWRALRRAMIETLRHADLPWEIWQQHAESLAAVLAGDGAAAEELMTAHSLDAADSLRSAYATRGGSAA
ncbi:GntR family transcriptional regulator [Roseicyclus sp.]